MSDQLRRPLQEDEQLYFIHVPKCAGTSFISLVDERYVIDEIIPTHHDINELKNHITDQQLAGYRFIRGHFPYDLVVPRLPRMPRIITFLREPITRFISNFQMRQRVSDPLVGLQETLKSLTLENFLDKPDLVRILANRATRLIGGTKKTRSGDVIPNLELAKERLSNFEFVGIVERFNDSLELFCHVFDFPPIRSQRNLNISPNREARSDISKTTMDKIAEIEWADIELYKFGLKLFERQHTGMGTDPIRGSLNNVGVGNSIRIDFARVNPGSGWHVGERYPRYGVVRWSGPDSVSYLHLTLAPCQSYKIRFRVLRSVKKEILQSLKLEINEQDVPLKMHLSDIWGGVIVEGFIPENVLSGGTPVEFAFKVSDTAPLSEINDNIKKFKRLTFGKQPNEPDKRLGGLLYNWLELTPEN